MDFSNQSSEILPEHLSRQLPQDGQRRLLAVGDIDLAGRYGVSLLAADNEFVYYVPEPGSPETDGELRIERVDMRTVRRVRIDGHIGNSSLVLERDDDSIVAARFSNSRLDQFDNAGRTLLELLAVRDGRDPSEAGQIRLAGRRPPSCPKCGRVLSPRAEVCFYCADKRKLFVRLIGLLKPHWKIAALSMMLAMAAAGLGLIPPYLTKPLTSDAILKGNMGKLVNLLALYAGAMVLTAIIGGLRTRVMGWLGQRVIYDLRGQAFHRLQELSLRYYESKQTGKLMNRVTSDVDRVERFVVEALQEIIVDAMTLAVILAILMSTSLRLALIVTIPTPLVALMVYFFSKRLKSTYRRAWRMAASLTAHLADVIPGVRVVKGFARENEEEQRFDRRSKRLFGHNVDVSNRRATFFPLVQLMGQSAYVLLWAVGGYIAVTATGQAQQDAIGTLVMFNTMIWRFYEPIGRLSRMSDQVQRATTSAERVFELLDAFPEVGEPAEPKPLPGANGRARGHVVFRNVSFCYEANVPVLKDIDLEIRPGEMIGIVGHSGVGKSTLASLLLRFYDPDHGQVLLDGVDVRELGTRQLRRNIGLVLQEPTLFHGSVRANISYGDHDATPEQVISSAKVANAHNFLLRLPEGYDTEIGERGVRLSQGEKQRVSIARAILPDPPILILDEATASVDTETERLIQSALDRLIKGRTVLAIAHRLSTLRNANRIIVLSEGRIAEMGTHDELMLRRGLYFDLCQAQSMMGRNITASPPGERRREEPGEPIEGEAEEVSQDGY